VVSSPFLRCCCNGHAARTVGLISERTRGLWWRNDHRILGDIQPSVAQRGLLEGEPAPHKIRQGVSGWPVWLPPSNVGTGMLEGAGHMEDQVNRTGFSGGRLV